MTYLPEMLASIAAQTRPPDEVIFVDDSSPDGSRDVLGAFIANRQGVAGRRLDLIINDRNMGQSASLNRGVAAASSDLIMILNDDDYLMHDAVETMLALFGRYRGVALIGANHVSFAGHEVLANAPKMSVDQVPSGRRSVIRGPEQVKGYRLADDLSMTHSGLCFLKVAWEAVGGYRADKQQRVVSSSDRDFQIRVNALFPVVAALDIPLAFWRNDSSVDGDLLS
jgi:GT2 family glycosyltransferase